MNKFSGIRYELQVMKEELRARLFDHSLFEMTCDDHQGKSHTLMHHIKEELQDVERALMKIDKGLYGYCEETGEEIPFEKLRVLQQPEQNMISFSRNYLKENPFPNTTILMKEHISQAAIFN